MHKKFLNLAIILIVISVLSSFAIYNKTIKRPLKGTGSTLIVASKTKQTFSSILANNKDKFSNTLFIKIYNKLNKVNISVNKGEYEIPSDVSLKELLDILSTNKYNTSIKKITIPEGYTIEQIAETLEKNEIVTKHDFMEACRKYPLPSYVQTNSERRERLEGFLFPDTYYFEKNMKAEDIIRIMTSRLNDIFKEIEKENNIKISDEDKDMIITKASIIEREVNIDSEKALVSSVINNRIEKDIKLQIDATVLYALGKHKDKVLYSDLKTQSGYNTYHVKGLPVGPISNPGKSAIEAAIFPKQTEYLYYITKNNQKHEFFKTYQDFLEYKNN